MRTLIILLGAATAAGALTACASSDYAYNGDRYASACERDYARNRDRATAAGALLGGAAGAAIDDDNDARGAAIGAVVGGLIGSQVGREDDPCGYGYGGYNSERAYAYDDRYDTRYGYWDRNGRWVRR